MNRQFRRTATASISLVLTLCCQAALAQEAAVLLPATASAPATQAATTSTQPATTAAATTSTQPATMSTQPATATAPSTQAAATESATQTATSPLSVSKRVEFNFKDASVDAVLNYLSEALGFIVIKDARIEGRVTITSRQPVTADEAVALVNSVLQPLGYTAMRSERVLRIMSREKAKKNVPVHFGADPLMIKATDELITQVIPLGQVDAVKLRQDFGSMFSADADVVANASSNTLVITDTSASIRRLVEIISAMDRHLATNAEVRVFQLKYASAAAAAKLITDVFRQDDAAGQGGAAGRRNFGGGFPGFGGGFGGGRGGPGGGGGAAGGAADTASSPRTGKVTASSDDRTNTLVVTGPVETLAVIDDVVKKLDANPAEESTVFIYNLKNAQSANLQGVLNSLFGTGTGGTSNTGRSSTGFTPLGTNTSSLGGRSTGGGTTGSRTGTSFGGGSGTTGGGTANRTGGGGGAFGGGFGGSAASASLGRANSDLVGQVFVVAESDTNSLLVTTNAKLADRVKAIIADLDRDVPQVLIKVLVAEVTHDVGADYGIEYSILNKRPSGQGQSGGSDFGLAATVAAAAAAGGPNGLVASVLESNIAVTLRALATAGKLDVLSRPSILASDNQLASIMVGQSVPLITSSNITTTGNIVNSVSYQDVGIILNVTPHINPDGLVILDVAPVISQISAQTVTVQAGVTVPVIDKRSAQSRVAIKNGQTIIIGGLMQDTKSETVNKIPLLGDIPGLGELFKHTTTKKQKTELLIFMTPIVAFQPDALRGVSEQDQKALKIVPNAVGPGVFDEHMQGLKRGTTQPSTRAATQPGASQPAASQPAATQP